MRARARARIARRSRRAPRSRRVTRRVVVARARSLADNNGNHLHLRNGLVAQFQALTVFAVICAALQTVCLYQLYANQHAVGAQVKAAGTADGGLAMEPLLASAKVVQQAAVVERPETPEDLGP